jgi:hypothetical protein
MLAKSYIKISCSILTGIILALSMVVQPVFAQSNDSTACTPDAQKICPAEVSKRDRPAVVKCLTEKIDKVTPQCRAVLEKGKSGAPAAKPN